MWDEKRRQHGQERGVPKGSLNCPDKSSWREQKCPQGRAMRWLCLLLSASRSSITACNCSFARKKMFFLVLHVEHNFQEKVNTYSLIRVDLLEREFQNKYTHQRAVCQCICPRSLACFPAVPDLTADSSKVSCQERPCFLAMHRDDAHRIGAAALSDRQQQGRADC